MTGLRIRRLWLVRLAVALLLLTSTTLPVSGRTGAKPDPLATRFARTKDVPPTTTRTQDEHALHLLSRLGGRAASVAVPPSGNYAYLGEGTALSVLDTSNPSQPSLVAQLLLLDEVEDIALQGNTAYLANRADGLALVDLSDPTQPALLSHYDTPGSATAVHISGTLAYVADGDGGLQIVDVFDPGSPTRLASHDTSAPATDVFVAGSYAYLTTDGGDAWLHVLDVSDPAQPTPVGTYDLPGTAFRIHVAGSTAYVAADGAGLVILDVSDPASPTLLRHYHTGGYPTDVQVVGTTAYVANYFPGLLILDVTHPANPTTLATVDTAWFGYRVVAAQHRAYLTDLNKGLRILDVTHPATPQLLGTYDRPGFVTDVAIMDASDAHTLAPAIPYDCLLDWERLWVMDLMDPSNLSTVGVYRLQGSSAQTLFISTHPTSGDAMAYVVDPLSGLELLSLLIAASPSFVGRYQPPADSAANDVFVAGQYAYLPTSSGATGDGWWRSRRLPEGDGWLRILDLSSPASPTQIAAYDTPGDARSVFVAAGIACVADGPAGLRLVDVSNPTLPAELGHLDPPTVTATTDAIYVAADRAYSGSSAGSTGYFQILDVSDPANPLLLDTYTVDGPIHDIQVRGTDAFLAVGGQGVWWLDVAGAHITPVARHAALNAVAIAPFRLGGPGSLTQFVPWRLLVAMRSLGAQVVKSVQVHPPTPTPTTPATPTPTNTSPPAPTPTATFTPQPTPTFTPEGTPTFTATPTPLGTPVASWMKAATPDAVAPSQRITYTVRLSWRSPDGLGAASTMSDTIPAYTWCDLDTLWTDIGEVKYDPFASPPRIFWAGFIPSGQTATIRFAVVVLCEPLVEKGNSEWPEKIENVAGGNIDGFPYSAGTSTTLLKPDLTITGLEVTQAIQNLNNDMWLIKRKETYVRLYVKAEYPGTVSYCHIPGVTAELTGGPGPPLKPLMDVHAQVMPPGDPRPNRWERDNLGATLNFRLPRPWRTQASEYTIRAQLNPDGDRPDRDLDNNAYEQQVSFVDTERLHIYVYPIKYTYKGAKLEPAKNAHKDPAKALRILPISDENRRFYWRNPLEVNWSLATEDDMKRVIYLLDKQRSWGTVRDHYYGYGLLQSSVPTGITLGMGQIDGHLAWGKLSDTSHEAGMTWAHELGHNLGRLHAPCGVTKDLDPLWAYPPCQISHGTREGYYGFDTMRPNVNVRDPRTHSDVMGYGRPQWISAHTYNGIYQRVRVVATGLEATQAQTQERLLVSGVITPSIPAASLDYAYRFDNPTFQNDPVTGTYTLELQDSQGQTLVTDTFGVEIIELQAGASTLEEDGSVGILPFLRALPYNPQATRLLLRQDGTVLASRVASANPPTVTVTYPNGGEAPSGTVTLTWSGFDPDGDPLEYVVQYSADGGATWEPVAIGLTMTNSTVDTEQLAGGNECILRVAASDGFHTAYDTSDRFFHLPRKPPTVLVFEPDNGQAFAPGDWVVLKPLAYDQDYNDLAEENLVWVSDRDGTLGTGYEVELTTLSLGRHIITLTGTDSEGMSNTDSVDVYVGYRMSLPLLLRDHRP